MATILRDLSYRYPWLYNTISTVAAVAVGGEKRFRQLPLQNVKISKDTPVLDLCCGGGQVTRYLVQYSDQVTGLDASPWAVQRAKGNVPQADYVEALAEDMPFSDEQFEVVHTSVALHEMTPPQRQKILEEVYRVLRPQGVFTLLDFHKPTNPLFYPGLALFMGLFETETAWQLIETDLLAQLKEVGFKNCDRTLYAGGSLQVIQAQK
ncbi:class I SAM-dependent methyltransferase [Spirulina sp. CS-785/01]|uniref:class I SAM-dependent methyltransferase n=1 Tax=Spirulina sp. CS-785/01 TaxID=3021716 RepID=UPI00232BF54D|nr:class I SAM-dependent methyltransferase [Spirulina sp. CS-785/01]MDB9314965.1 class I SAM-dependent methyltransferase [Spirulina sp. CS-785/01]